MRYFGGNIFRDGSFENGYIGIEGDLIQEYLSEPPPDAHEVHHGTVLPPLVNFHTHIGDASIEPPQGMPFEEVIKPPDGFKHRALASLDSATLKDGMQRCVRSMLASGVGHFCDFREGGIGGVTLLREALSGVGTPVPTCSIFGRPADMRYDPKDLEELLTMVDGLGLSGLGDWDFETIRQVADHAHERGKFVALHASEFRREPLGKILELRPDLLVHMTKATTDDLQVIAEEGIPLVVCPRNNLLAGNRVDIPAMVSAGVEVYLGTDNAMFNHPSPFQELECAFAISKDFGILDPEILIQMVTATTKKVLNLWGGISLDPGNSADFLYLRFPKGLESRDAICNGHGDGSIEAVYFRGRPVYSK